MLELSSDTAHLWVLWPDLIQEPSLLASYHALMSADEVAQHDRFVFPKGKREYLLTRALVRTVLSRYAPVAPQDWVFVRNSHGRPSIETQQNPLQIRFNLSNTQGLIACLVTHGREVGLDVEYTPRKTNPVEIAEHYFSPKEVKALHAQPTARQRDRFFMYWTLKEAYIKAKGLGLAIPLDQFTFLLDAGPKIAIEFDPKQQDDPSNWQFQLYRPSPDHFMATALHATSEEKINIETRHTIPLQKESLVEISGLF